MIRGIRKRVIRMKGKANGLFDEAYFVVSDHVGAGPNGKSERDMIAEAARIIERSDFRPDRRPEDVGRGRLSAFLIGLMTGALICAAAWLIAWL